MADIKDETSFHVPDLPPPPTVAKVNLIERLKEQQQAAKKPPAAPPPPPQPAKPKDHHLEEEIASDSKAWLVGSVTAAVLLAAIGAYYLAEDKSAVPLISPSPVFSATPLPSPSPTPTATPRPVVKPKPGQRTYTVKGGDTLITIGAKLHKDWRAIADANGNKIHDPNLIYPGQVLIIP